MDGYWGYPHAYLPDHSVLMRETQKFHLPNGNEVTISEVDQGDYEEDKILLMLEEAEKDSMALLLTKREAWGIGRAIMHLGYTLEAGRNE